MHAGEFPRLIRELAPDKEKFYAEGAAEVEEEIETMKSDSPQKSLAGRAAGHQ